MPRSKTKKPKIIKKMGRTADKSMWPKPVYVAVQGDVTDPAVPISWFTSHEFLRPGQAVSLFLIDVLGYTYTDAALLLGKSEGTVRTSYKIASDKEKAHKEKKKEIKEVEIK